MKLNLIKKVLTLFFCTVLFVACSKNKNIVAQDDLYFPPNTSNEWLTINPNELGWNPTEIEHLKTFLASNHTRAFIILKEGKIVWEAYFGKTISGTQDFDVNSQWYWASAGKTITAVLAGIAQQEGSLNINHPTSDYLGKGWTGMSFDKEQLITVKNQLSMTTGLDYEITNPDCTTPSCLKYKSDAGTQWFYHNAPYTLIEKVIENQTGLSYNDYTRIKLTSIIGMNGTWIKQGYNNVYWSTARDMARFGLFILNHGRWKNTTVISDTNYFSQMTNSSQQLNPSYGYLWWLNGKPSIIYPSNSSSFNTSLSAAAPSDLIAGMGKNGQFIDIIPSKNMVVVRMGETPDEALVPFVFHDEMWKKINRIIE